MTAPRFGGIIAGPLHDLPLLGEDMYLRMQAVNLSIVDVYLRDLERQLLAEYIELERTPLPTAVFVSSLSQLWVFGLYELLRTWRQRTREAREFADRLSALSTPEREVYIADRKAAFDSGNPFYGSESMRWGPFAAIMKDPDGERSRIQKAVDRTEVLFRRLEALRVHLAKHELPQQRGSEAMAPGYGRIDMSDGSIAYQVLLRDNEVDLLSRRTITHALEELADVSEGAFLPVSVRHLLRGMEETSYGVKQVAVRLEDGTTYEPVWILWDCQIVGAADHEDLPFNPANIVDVAPPTSERDPRS